MIEIVRSKKGFSFHSIMLGLTRIELKSVKGGRRETTCFEFLVFLFSFLGSFLKISVLSSLEFNVPFERCEESSEMPKASSHYPIPCILLFSRLSSPLAFGFRYQGGMHWHRRGSRTFSNHIIKLLLQLRVLFVCIFKYRLLIRVFLMNLVLPK